MKHFPSFLTKEANNMTNKLTAVSVLVLYWYSVITGVCGAVAAYRCSLLLGYS